MLERDFFCRIDEDWAARRGLCKLVSAPGKEPQLFNLDNDIGETTDLASQHPDLVKDLIAKFHAWELDVDDK